MRLPRMTTRRWMIAVGLVSISLGAAMELQRRSLMYELHFPHLRVSAMASAGQAGHDNGSGLATPLRSAGLLQAGPIETDLRGDRRAGWSAYSPGSAAVSQARA